MLGGSTFEQDTVFANALEGIGYGFEVAVQHRVDADWMLSAGYAFLVLDLPRAWTTTCPSPSSGRSWRPPWTGR